MEIAVNTSTLAGDIVELKNELVNARKLLSDMFGQVAELDEMWAGPAHEEFRRQFGIDYEDARNLCNTVESLLVSMVNAREQYDKCEDTVNEIVSAISI